MRPSFKTAASVIFAALLFNNAWAQKAELAWDLGASIYFDNTEYDVSGSELEDSRTLFGIRANAAVGVQRNSRHTTHRILGGISALYHFGGKLNIEPMVYYKMQTELRNCGFSIVAGAFDRKESKAYYSPAFFSNYDRFIRGTYDGIQFAWDSKRSYAELGVDWMGMISKTQPSVREEFRVYSGGKVNIAGGLDFGYAAQLHHYACSMEADGVVDDALVNPYFEFEFAKYAKVFESLLLRTGMLIGYQNDRIHESGVLVPLDGNIYAKISKWRVSIDNDVYFGSEMMPFYDTIAPEGVPYSTNLYLGQPLLRHRDSSESFGYFDRLGIAWEPRIAKGLDFKLRVNFDFNNGFLGTQQIIGIAYRF